MVTMRRRLAIFLTAVGFMGALLSHGVALAQGQDDPHGALLESDGTIQPISARFFARGIDKATQDGAHVLIVRLDTPGGLFDSTRDMVEDILASKVPVVVYVSPAGSRAASAGTFITAAAHVAAMAPGTNIGAAAPVGAQGEDLPETLEEKASQDAAAFIRSIAEERGRNAEALEDTVIEAVSYTATEALEKDVIDLVARDLDDLLLALDGRTVRIEDGSVLLQTKGLELRRIEQTLVERFLNIIAEPNIAFMLLSIGSLGLFIEFMNPGMFIPGIIGVLALAMALVALGNLPVNWVGVGLLGLAMLMLYLEMQAPGTSVFGVAGVIKFVLGAFLLFGGFTPPPIDTPSFRVDLWLILVVAGAMFGGVLFLVRDMMAARSGAETATPSTASTLVGQIAVAATALAPAGTVHAAGEYWSAVSDSGDPINEGDEAMVLEANGLTLKVFKSPSSDDDMT